MNSKIYDSIRVTGAKGLSHTIKAAAAVETTPAHPDGQVTIQLTAAHGLLTGSMVYIEGTTNYDGLAEILAVPATDKITIKAKYVAETFAGSETVKVAIVPNCRFRFCGFHLHLSAAPTTSENFTITLDANDGSAYDVVIYSRNFSTASDTDILWSIPDDSQPSFEKGDKIRIAWTNTDTKTFGLKLKWRREN